jgi:hypothetical protein
MNTNLRGKYMKTRMLLLIAIIMMIAVQTTTYAEANFSASSLNASDVNCKKCHTDTPHIIHAQKPAATCERCHGDKLSVAIPQCTKCHDGTIHKVHAGKVSTQKCDYCHKTVSQVHIDLTSGAVCAHCHKDLVEVHGASGSCQKCHKTPPDIVKPLKSEGMVLVCQNCHPASSIATIHGSIDSKQGCYNCHKGASNLNGSEVPHTIHIGKASCEDCHKDNGQVVIPKCEKCHKIDELHAFDKIGTKTTNLNCKICHSGITKPSEEVNKTQVVQTVQVPVQKNVTDVGVIPGIVTTP